MSRLSQLPWDRWFLLYSASHERVYNLNRTSKLHSCNLWLIINKGVRDFYTLSLVQRNKLDRNLRVELTKQKTRWSEVISRWHQAQRCRERAVSATKLLDDLEYLRIDCDKKSRNDKTTTERKRFYSVETGESLWFQCFRMSWLEAVDFVDGWSITLLGKDSLISRSYTWPAYGFIVGEAERYIHYSYGFLLEVGKRWKKCCCWGWSGENDTLNAETGRVYNGHHVELPACVWWSKSRKLDCARW